MMEPVIVARIRCDLCGALVTKIRNCPCGCGVAACGLCGTYYHIMDPQASKGTPHRWWTT